MKNQDPKCQERKNDPNFKDQISIGIWNLNYWILLALLVLGSWFLILVISVLPQTASAADTVESASPFTDVPPESQFFLPVNFLKEQNFVAGFSDGTFRPGNPVSRAEALAMILKVNGICNDNATTRPSRSEAKQLMRPKGATLAQQKKMKKPFRDVKKSDWFFNLVREAKKRKIVTGTGDSKFRPNEPVKLAEALRMLFEASDTEIEGITAELPTRIASDAWYAKDIAYAVSETILTQQEDGSIFPPEGELTRGQLALLLYRFLKTQDTMTFGYASWYGDGLAKTKLPKNKEYAEKYLTAAHKILPFGTIVRVTNVANGKSVDVVVNDRGPYVTGRIIDLSKTAFRALEYPGMGLILVQIEQLE